MVPPSTANAVRVPEFFSPSAHGHSLHELEALARDCHLYEILPTTFVASDTVIDPTVRLRALAANLGESAARQGVFARLTAAWIFGCAAIPDRITVHVDRYHRPIRNHSPLPLINLQAPVPSNEVRRLGGLAVTSIERTAADLVSFPDGSASHYALLRLLRKYHAILDIPAIVDSLEAQRPAAVRTVFMAALREAHYARRVPPDVR